MSHSKYNKRGHSLYLDNWNPFTLTINEVICEELAKKFSVLELDEYGLYKDCARIQESQHA